ncbi:MAG: sensor histidine kinase [Gammaproteobacteria bacterium]
MQTPTLQPTQKTEQLTDAFRLFNELSQNLSDAYQSLEKQVAKLHGELAAARSDRLRTLIEKEKIAGRLQQILAALPAAIIVLDVDGKVVDYNAMASDFLGEPLAGISWFDVIELKLKSVFDSPHEKLLDCGRRVSVSYNALDKGAGQIVLLSDVSEMRALQERVSQQKHLSAMGEMVASMAHQVRTPLSTAILYASHLARSGLDEDKRQRFSLKMLERLHYLERQVNDMLIYAKEGRLTMETFSLDDLLKNVREALQDRVPTESINLRIVNDAKVGQMSGNETALRGALLNLVDNAVEACSDLGTIVLSIGQSNPSELLIKVSDNGGGMAKNMCTRIFEPFYTTKNSGTGLGLAVVDSVARAHGGCVSCVSEPGKGTVFTVTLPVVTGAGSAGILPGGFSGKLYNNEREDRHDTV